MTFALTLRAVAKPDYSESKIVLAMVSSPTADHFREFISAGSQVGLPARGKSYLSNKLMIYLKVRSSLDQA